MQPYSIYILDITIRISYLLISFIFCFFIFLQFIEIVFLFEVSPVVFSMTSKRFIATQLTQLFSTIWLFCIKLSFTFIFPLVVHHTKYFFTSSWYSYQIQFYGRVLTWFFLIFFLIFSTTHLFLTPHLIAFFLYWEINDEYSLLRIETEISLFFYVLWIFAIKFSISLIFALFWVIYFLIFYFTSTKYLYFFMFYQKKIFLFSLIFLITFLLPPDFFIQFILVTFIFFVIELFLLIICFKLSYLKLLNNM